MGGECLSNAVQRTEAENATIECGSPPTYSIEEKSMSQCEKCYKRLNDCQSCKGRGGGYGIAGRLNCSACRNTGLVCNTHDGHWKK